MSKNKGFSITSADRYSLALYELASDGNVLKSVESQCFSVLNLILSGKDFSKLIKDPTNNQEDLLKVINIISENNKFEKFLLDEIRFKIEEDWLSIDSRTLPSLASSYKAKEYLSAEVIENPLFLLNLIPLLCWRFILKTRFN